MSFNFLPQTRSLEILTFEEGTNLVENKDAEHFFYKIKNTMFGIKVFLLYENKVYFLNRENGMNYYERVHTKDYLKMIKETREENE